MDANKRGDYAAARDGFLRAHELQPAHPPHLISAANMAYKHGDLEGALPLYRKALELPLSAAQDKIVQDKLVAIEAKKQQATAAAKVQAIQRGNLARKGLAALDAEAKAEEADASADVAKAEEAEAVAAAKLQAIQRGNAARKELKSGKPDAGAEVEASEAAKLAAAERAAA
eukprot:7294296-Prymnesium_polylepis.1